MLVIVAWFCFLSGFLVYPVLGYMAYAYIEVGYGLMPEIALGLAAVNTIGQLILAHAIDEFESDETDTLIVPPWRLRSVEMQELDTLEAELFSRAR